MLFIAAAITWASTGMLNTSAFPLMCKNKFNSRLGQPASDGLGPNTVYLAGHRRSHPVTTNPPGKFFKLGMRVSTRFGLLV